MAGHWIKWEKGLMRKPEIMAIAQALGCSDAHAAGVCMTVWEWADDVTTEGIIRIDKRSVDKVSGQPGLADAMVAVGWLVVSDSAIQFPNYDRHNGLTAKERALDANRKRVWRASGQKPDVNPDYNRTKTGRVHR